MSSTTADVSLSVSNDLPTSFVITPRFLSNRERKLIAEKNAAVSMDSEITEALSSPVKETIIPPPVKVEIDPVFTNAAGRIAMYLLENTEINQELAKEALADTVASTSWKLNPHDRTFYAQISESLRVKVQAEIVVFNDTKRFSLGSTNLFALLRAANPAANEVLLEQERIDDLVSASLFFEFDEERVFEEPKDSEPDVLDELLAIDEEASVCGDIFAEIDPEVLREVIPPMTIEEEAHLFDYFPDSMLEISYNDELEKHTTDAASKIAHATAQPLNSALKANPEEARTDTVKDSPEGKTASEEPMKIEPKDENNTRVHEGYSEADQQAAEKGTLQYLKSVQGRVLTIMEAAFPNDEQRNAVKTLVKKEFRREMERVNRAGAGLVESDNEI
jgi:hypothetical protein